MFIERLVKDRKDLHLSTTKDSSDPNKKEKKAPRQKVVARDIQHLKKLINKVVKEDGNKCDLNFIDVSHIEDMSYLFADIDFNGDISQWDVSNVTDMSFMFACSNFVTAK
ncbi:MAG: BspA family leucine-rich repeat surface protein [Synergistales bacterium]|nr:BspA family leucine-rich repeat surface protein [Synergistales bacterium]